MKKVLRMLLSMRTANTLLALVALLCALSSLLPQGRGLPFYAENYPRAYVLIYRTHFYDVFGSWYFTLLMALLCLSMLLCTGRMFLRCVRGLRRSLEQDAALPDAESLEPGQLEELRRWAASTRCKEERVGEVYVFRKNRLGFWGLPLLHLSILLTVLFGLFALVLPKVTDLDCRVGESVSLKDGTQIAVESFRVRDESGKLDYASRIRITLPDGRQSPVQEIKVNYPMSFGSVKIFQWTYGVEGFVQARSRTEGWEERLELEPPCFLSADGENGVQVLGLYETDPQEGEKGESQAFYRVCLISSGTVMPEMAAIPGETLSMGDLDFEFLDPYYPGLRVKQMPFPYVNSLLEGAFVLMLAGLFLCFYLQPVLVKADEMGYTVAGPRPEKTRLELRRRLQKEAEEK